MTIWVTQTGFEWKREVGSAGQGTTRKRAPPRRTMVSMVVSWGRFTLTPSTEIS